MEPTEQTGLMQPQPKSIVQQCDGLLRNPKKYPYTTEQRREYEMRYRAKHPGGRKRITAKYIKATSAVYAASAKRYQNKLKVSRDELVELKAKLPQISPYKFARIIF